MTDIFLSYASEDRERIVQIAEGLKAQGWKVFDDRAIPAGENWQEHIYQQLADSRVVIVIWTRAAASSRWVQEEITMAQSGNTALIPLLAEDADQSTLPAALAGRQAVNLVGWTGDYKAPAWRTLVAALEALVPRATTRSAESKRGNKDGRTRRIRIPDVDWLPIPAGQFIYSRSDQLAYLMLDGFQIARYPVTNAQYQTFIDDGGYKNSRWWHGLERPSSAQRPSAWPQTNRPRTDIAWGEAVAFSRWLADVTGEPIRLPTLPEWEKAARGTDGRDYPWGNDYADGMANIETPQGASAKRQPCAVGLFPHAKSPYGVEDMYGNVWEWCLTESTDPADMQVPVVDPKTDDDDGLGPSTPGRELMVGCSWMEPGSVPVHGRATEYGLGLMRPGTVGFRLVRTSDVATP
jgi:formylglycine-generating enzyme required for sulfatase activity